MDEIKEGVGRDRKIRSKGQYAEFEGNWGRIPSLINSKGAEHPLAPPLEMRAEKGEAK